MKKKAFIGQLLSVHFSDRKEPISGIVLDYTDEWTWMRYNPVDYVVDGYILFRHKNILHYIRDEKERFTEKIIKLKKQDTSTEKIPLESLETILRYLTDTHGIFQFYTKSEKACYLGRLQSIDSKNLQIEFLDPRAKWTGKMTFRPGDVRVIHFDTDYINSLKLLAASRKRVTPKTI